MTTSWSVGPIVDSEHVNAETLELTWIYTSTMACDLVIDDITIIYDGTPFTQTPSPTNTPTHTPTPTNTPTATAIPTVRYSNDPLLLPDVDAEGCPANDVYQCAEQVYDQYYAAFQTEYSRVPVWRDLIAVLFKLELVINISDARAAMGNNFVNSCGSGCNRTQLISWLSSLQGWTDFGETSGVVDTAPLVAYTNQSTFEGIADQIVGQSISWPGACTTTNPDIPCYWGNWALGDTDYQNIRDATSGVVFCVIYQGWADGGQANVVDRPPDFWYDYLYAVITYNQNVIIGDISIYNPDSSPRPGWLDDQTKRTLRQGTSYSPTCPGTQD